MLREVSLMAGASRSVMRSNTIDVKGEAYAGGAIMTGAGDVMPFRVLPSLLPVGEAGFAVSLLRGLPSMSTLSGGPTIFAHVNGVRLSSIDSTVGMADGWTTRFIIGIRSGY